jgi:quinohemoprotein amine dehydrogenase
MRNVTWAAGAIAVLAAFPLAARSQQPQPASQAQGQRSGDTAADEGIPVTDPEVHKACGACHTLDDKQRMTRISYRRATPENWELTIRRMMSLNNVQISPEAARPSSSLFPTRTAWPPRKRARSCSTPSGA